MKRTFWWIVHLFNTEKCWDNSFWFYGKLFCKKCGRGVAYLKFLDDDATEFYPLLKKKTK